jgi:Protein-L-isoaspartate carboxylmethyltransferase
MESPFNILPELKSQGIDRKVINSFLKIPREKFLPDRERSKAYSIEYLSTPIPIWGNQNTTALDLGLKMISYLDLIQGKKVLEIGTGCGYYTAIIWELINGKFLYTTEINEELCKRGKETLISLNIKPKFYCTDGSKGIAGEKFDRIISWAAFEEEPGDLILSLRAKGILIAPVGKGKYKISCFTIKIRISRAFPWVK